MMLPIMDLIGKIQDKPLQKIADKVISKTPVDQKDTAYMLSAANILDLGSIADFIRTELHQNKTYYGVNMNLNYTNICELRCPLCAFSCDKNDNHAFQDSPF